MKKHILILSFLSASCANNCMEQETINEGPILILSQGGTTMTITGNKHNLTPEAQKRISLIPKVTFSPKNEDLEAIRKDIAAINQLSSKNTEMPPLDIPEYTDLHIELEEKLLKAYSIEKHQENYINLLKQREQTTLNEYLSQTREKEKQDATAALEGAVSLYQILQGIQKFRENEFPKYTPMIIQSQEQHLMNMYIDEINKIANLLSALDLEDKMNFKSKF